MWRASFLNATSGGFHELLVRLLGTDSPCRVQSIACFQKARPACRRYSSVVKINPSWVDRRQLGCSWYASGAARCSLQLSKLPPSHPRSTMHAAATTCHWSRPQNSNKCDTFVPYPKTLCSVSLAVRSGSTCKLQVQPRIRLPLARERENYQVSAVADQEKNLGGAEKHATTTCSSIKTPHKREI